MIPSRRPLLPALFVLALVAAPARGLDAELNKPYQLRVVLDVAKHRLLTDVFRQQVKRELQASLRAAFGELAEVTVADEHPLLAQVRQFGLKKVLDDWLDLDGIKTHFVLVDFAGGQYEVRARQHDGLTGQASPVVRVDRTTDRQFVARLAALLVDRDFGLVGTVPAGADPKDVRVEIKGGQLGVLLGPWLQKDDLLLVAPIPGGDKGRRVMLDEAALLQVAEAPDKGVCRCRLFARYQDPLSRPGVVGYRCLKLHTITAPLHLRLLQKGASTPTPVSTITVNVRHRSFEGDDKLQSTSDRDGYVHVYADVKRGRREETFDRLAFVTVGEDTRPVARIPLAVVDTSPVNLRVTPQPLDADSGLAFEKKQWEEEVTDAGLVQRALFEELQKFAEKANLRSQALKRAEDGLKSSRAEWTRLKRKRDDLRKKEGGAQLDLSFGEQWLESLKMGHAALEFYIDTQRKILADENDPRRVKWLGLIQQGKLEEGNYEFEKALELYDRALQDYPKFKDPELQKRRDELWRRWRPQGPEHEKARVFIYETWPKADLMKDKGVFKQAHDALEVCRQKKDILAPLKLLQAAITHGGELQKRKEALDLDSSEEDRKIAEGIAERSKELKELITAVQAYLQRATGGK
ncbi:MAG: hypothetical protein HYS12_27080 [Planctomycetes bacterium]|nr:hypothetical protein [Planctomycetota bacterium]